MVALDLSLGALLNAGSGLLLAAFGLYVATRVPRRRANVAFGVFAAAFGLVLVPNNIVTFDPLWLNPGFVAGYVGLWLVAASALVAFGLLVPKPLARGDRRRVVVPALAAAAFLLSSVALFVQDRPRVLEVLATRGIPSGAGPAFWWTTVVGVSILLAAFYLVMVLLALRFPHLDRADGGAERDQVVVFTAALLLWPAAAAGAFLVPGPFWSRTVGVPGVVLIVCLTVLWLRNTGLGRAGASTRATRNLALLGPVVVLVSLLGTLAWAGAVDPAFGSTRSPAFGIARTLGVLILGYGLLRHQLFGIDLKVKWSIKQSTLAALFIAVFFVVSEGAQQFFAATTLGPWLGILAAGALLFALAPLQRFAERVADTAMPHVKAPDEMTDDERLALYRRQVEIAWTDGSLSANERLMLKDLREQLGLSAEAAERVDADVAARETRAGGEA